MEVSQSESLTGCLNHMTVATGYLILFFYLPEKLILGNFLALFKQNDFLPLKNRKFSKFEICQGACSVYFNIKLMKKADLDYDYLETV